MDRVRIFKSVLWAIVGLGGAAWITRMLVGLGSIANMNDAVPWGFWKGFNIFPGIALAGGGFVMTAVIYVMARKEYHKYARVSVLLALLGYTTAATALVTELGLPWMVWHPLIYWQHHSALFEVSWCVMLYLTVLFLEFLPVPLEETGWFAGVRRFLTKYKIVLVFLGIMISTLHQSSLGSMWLITPEKLHPLWYTPLLPILFFLSAVAIGPLMLILAILVISSIYRKEIDRQVLSKLSALSGICIFVYGATRIIDIIIEGKFSLIFNGSWQSNMFLIEMTLMVIAPLILIGLHRFRYSTTGLWVTSLCSVIGLGLNRADIAGIMLNVEGPAYTPTLFEILVGLAIISGAILAFLFCLERFKIMEIKWRDPWDNLKCSPRFANTAEIWPGTPRLSGWSVYSLIVVIALAVGFTMIPSERIHGGGIKHTIAQKALGGDILLIDGNRDNYGVAFPHEAHIQKNGGKKSCVLCHHMNMPLDSNTTCENCHRNMYQSADAFRHDWHASPNGGNIPCTECHPRGQEKSGKTAKTCDQCHKDLIPAGTTIAVKQYMAPSYAESMHGLCVSCHQQKVAETPDKPNLNKCATCHTEKIQERIGQELTKEYAHPYFNHVVMPASKKSNNKTANAESL